MLMPHIFYRHLNAAMQITILMCENCSKIYFCDIVYFEPQKILYVHFFIFFILNYGWGKKLKRRIKT